MMAGDSAGQSEGPMSGIYKNRRRIAGCAVLAIAVLLLIGWFRSRFYCDVVQLTFGGKLYDVVSVGDRICWKLRGDRQQSWFGWQRINVSEFNQIHSGLTDIDAGPGSVVIPYWWLVAPPTLLSAWLLLWPRPLRATTERKRCREFRFGRS